MEPRPRNDRQPWSRNDLILAFDLYCRIPFQRTKATEPRVRELAKLLHRTPASDARKLGNFGAFDPHLAARNISGLTHGSKLDKAVWDEFHADWSGLVERAQQLRQQYMSSTNQDSKIQTPPDGPSERIVTAKQRLHQSFFREAILSSYNSRCCITGLPVVECLVAGHILPWSVDERRRADPTNGLCLSATFERLFDAGLLCIEPDYTVCVSPRLHLLRDHAVTTLLLAYHGKQIALPARFPPCLDCLRWHRNHRFKAA